MRVTSCLRSQNPLVTMMNFTSKVVASLPCTLRMTPSFGMQEYEREVIQHAHGSMSRQVSRKWDRFAIPRVHVYLSSFRPPDVVHLWCGLHGSQTSRVFHVPDPSKSRDFSVCVKVKKDHKS